MPETAAESMPQSANEEIADEQRQHAVDLQRLAAGIVAAIAASFVALRTGLVGIIAGLDLDAASSGATQQKKLADKAVAAAKKIAAEGYGSIADEVLAALHDLVLHENERAAAAINAPFLAVVEDGGIVKPDDLSAARAAEIAESALIEGAPVSDWLERQAGDLVLRFTDAIRRGIAEGMTNAQMTDLVRGTRANSYKDGLVAISQRGAEALVRSAVMAVSNEAQLRFWTESASDVLKGFLHLSTLDNRTSLICVSRSGKMWTVDGDPIGGHKLPFRRPPLHWRCRSVLTPITKSWQDLGIDAPEMSPGTRASMDGQVPADLDFDTWLRGKSEVFQDDLLGVKRADLWRRGKIGLTDLVDQAGRELTVAQLTDLVNSRRRKS